MSKNKQFTINEKETFIKNFIEEQKCKEFNEKELLKEEIFKKYLIIIECTVAIGTVMITDYIFNFDWIFDINSWFTNIIVPLIIFNFFNSTRIIIERKIKKIRVWARILYYFASLVLTFFYFFFFKT